MSGIFGSCVNGPLTIEEANEMLGNLKTCAGLPHQVGSSIPTCAEMDAAIEAASTTVEEIAQVFRTCAGVDHVPEAHIPTCDEMDAAIASAIAAIPGTNVPSEVIAAVFKTCAGANHVPDTNIPTCAEMDAAIASAIVSPTPGFRAGNPTTGTDPLVGTAIGAVARTFLDKARETVSVFDFGVVGDNVVDDTVALQAAIDSCDATGKILDFGTAKMRTTGPVTAIGSFGGIICADAFAGIYPEGSGYTAITIGRDSLYNPGGGVDGSASFRTNNLDLAVFGTGNAVNGILIQFISLSVVKRLRAVNMAGFGVKMDWANNSTFEHISTELCGVSAYLGNGYTTTFAILLTGGFLGGQINQNTFTRIECELSRGGAFAVDPLAYNNHFSAIHSERCDSDGEDTFSWVFGGSTSIFEDIRIQTFVPGGLKARFITSNCIFNVVRIENVMGEFETWGNVGTIEQMATQVNMLRCEPFEQPDWNKPWISVKTDSLHNVNFNDCSISVFRSSNGKQNLTRCAVNQLTVEYMNKGNLNLFECVVGTITAIQGGIYNHVTATNTKFIKVDAMPAHMYADRCRFGGEQGSLTQFLLDNPFAPYPLPNIGGAYDIDIRFKTLTADGCEFDANVVSEVGTIIASKCKFFGHLVEFAVDHSSLLDDDNWYYGVVTNFDTEPTSALALVPRVGMRHYNAPPTVGQPKSWVCTDAIVPTWVAEGNL